MGKVRFLSQDVVNKIAAGEVVENPSSVVKEIVENSLDAGAENILIEIQSAGKGLISVKDDGCGIEPDDVEKLFKRHATSKISASDDLYNIQSLGFRGEALYSISAVADVVLRSKSRSCETGGREIHIRGGENIGVKDVSHPDGTTVEVRELFFNTPARRKFLKSDTTEFRRIINILLPYAIVFYSKRFSLTHNGRSVFNFNPSAGYLSRFAESINLDKKNLLSAEKELKEREISFKVLLGDINLKRPVRDKQYIFINDRPVYSQKLMYSVNQVYRVLFPRDVYPVFAIFLRLPSGDVDANIHPSKKEVKLKDEPYIASALGDFCREVLLSRSKVTAVRRESIYFDRNLSVSLPGENVPASERQGLESLFNRAGLHEQPEIEINETIRFKLQEAIYIGSYRNKYLFFESGDSLLVMDQHAAHERINYELLKKQFETGKIDIQRLLTPLLMKLSSEEMSVWEDGSMKMEEVGFLTTRWDDGSIALHGFPQVIKNPEMAVRSILSEGQVEKCDRDTLARRACKSSVVAGERIKPEESIYIKNELLRCEVPFVCPHGRPTVVEFSESFFDRQFLR
jgi:DNA mismatch repair protein MutL